MKWKNQILASLWFENVSYNQEANLFQLVFHQETLKKFWVFNFLPITQMPYQIQTTCVLYINAIRKMVIEIKSKFAKITMLLFIFMPNMYL